MLYWVAAVLEPTKKVKEETNAMEELVMQPKIVVARDDKDAAIKVVMGEESLKGLDKNNLQIIVRPF